MGLLGFLGDVAGAITNPLGTITHTVEGFLSNPGRWSPPTRTQTDTLAGIRAGPVGITLTNQRNVPMVSGGMSGIPSGYHVITNPHSKNYGKLTKNRHMNIGNGHALSRALRRVKRFEKIARTVIKVAPKFHARPKLGGLGRRHRRK